MRTIAALFFVVLALSLRLGAQSYSYVPFPMQNAVWKSTAISFQNGYMAPGHVNTTQSRYFLIGDSLLANGHRYARLYVEEGKTNVSRWQGQPVLDSQYRYCGIRTAGGIREENKKVYFWANDTTKEYLLYDFSMKVGDSIAAVKSLFASQAWLLSIDTIQVNGGSLRRAFHFSMVKNPIGVPFNTQLTIVEGIGRIDGDLLAAYSPSYFPYSGPPGGSFTASFNGFCYKNKVLWGGGTCDSLNIAISPYPYREFWAADTVKWVSNTQKLLNTPDKYLIELTQDIFDQTNETLIRAANSYRAVRRQSLPKTIVYRNGAMDTTIGTPTASLIGGFREANKKVYYWDEKTQRELLCYDFSLRVGDTLPANAVHNTLKLNKIDTVYHHKNKQWYRHYFFEDKQQNLYFDIAEGQGNLYQLPMLPYGDVTTDDSTWTQVIRSTYFFCFDGEIGYQESPQIPADCQYFFIAPALPVDTFMGILVHPNPLISGEGTLVFPKKMYESAGAMLSIFDAQGRMHYRMPITSAAVSLNSALLREGVYYCRYTNAAGEQASATMVVRK